MKHKSTLRNVLRGLALAAALGVSGVALHTVLNPGDTMFAGSRPKNLGVKAGRLAPPKRTPNCVSSQADSADRGHAIAPIAYAGSPAKAMADLRRIVADMAGSTIVEQTPTYLYAEFRSRVMGFVDDVEFSVAEDEGVIHARSASRLGRRDFGVNRARIETVRARFAAAQSGPAGN